MSQSLRNLICIGAMLPNLGCDNPTPPPPSVQAPLQSSSKPDTVDAPPGFDIKLLEILCCPENLTSLRLANRSELRLMNARIKDRGLRLWSGSTRESPLEAALIREDARIAYEIKGGVPILLIDGALVLDSSVGAPEPEKARRRK
ncbi:MAG TPA: hypothetical protein VF950_14765 [Planctomycetota bacterium]